MTVFDGLAPLGAPRAGFCVVGAFQFVRQRGGWHRVAGRVVVCVDLVAACSGVWMALFYPLPAADHPLLTVFRLVFGSLMVMAFWFAVAGTPNPVTRALLLAAGRVLNLAVVEKVIRGRGSR